jgi:hypothetical protein
MPSGEWPKMRVTRIEWDPANYEYGSIDYVMGMLLEIPEMYYIIPDRWLAYIYVIGRGIVALHHDFTFMTEEETDLFVYHLRRQYSIF